MLDLYFADGRLFGCVEPQSGAIHDTEGRFRGWVESDGAVYRADGEYAGDLAEGGYVLRDPSRPAPPRRAPPPAAVAAKCRPPRGPHANRGTLRLAGTGRVDALPALAAAPGTEPPFADSAARPPGDDVPRRKLVVLVATQDGTQRREFCEALEAAGYAVLEAESGDEALAVARGRVGPVDLLLADLHLSGAMTGAALARTLTGWHPGLRALFLDGAAAARPERPPERRGLWARLAPATAATPARPAPAAPDAEEEEGELYAVLRTPVQAEELVRAVRAVLGRG